MILVTTFPYTISICDPCFTNTSYSHWTSFLTNVDLRSKKLITVSFDPGTILSEELPLASLDVHLHKVKGSQAKGP